MSETPTSPAEDTTPEGQTPSAPDVDQPDGGTGSARRAPGNPDADQPDSGDGA